MSTTPYGMKEVTLMKIADVAKKAEKSTYQFM